MDPVGRHVGKETKKKLGTHIGIRAKSVQTLDELGQLLQVSSAVDIVLLWCLIEEYTPNS